MKTIAIIFVLMSICASNGHSEDNNSLPDLNSARIMKKLEPVFGLYRQEFLPGQLDFLVNISIKHDALLIEGWRALKGPGQGKHHMFFYAPIKELMIRERPAEDDPKVQEFFISSFKSSQDEISFSWYKDKWPTDGLMTLHLPEMKIGFLTLAKTTPAAEKADPLVRQYHDKIWSIEERHNLLSPIDFINGRTLSACILKLMGMKKDE